MTWCVNSLNTWAGPPPTEDLLPDGSGRVSSRHSPAAWSPLGNTGRGTPLQDVEVTPVLSSMATARTSFLGPREAAPHSAPFAEQTEDTSWVTVLKYSVSRGLFVLITLTLIQWGTPTKDVRSRTVSPSAPSVLSSASCALGHSASNNR